MNKVIIKIRYSVYVWFNYNEVFVLQFFFNIIQRVKRSFKFIKMKLGDFMLYFFNIV